MGRDTAVTNASCMQSLLLSLVCVALSWYHICCIENYICNNNSENFYYSNNCNNCHIKINAVKVKVFSVCVILWL